MRLMRRAAWRSAPQRARPQPDRSLSLRAAAFMGLLVVYASLYPFEGWRWPSGAEWSTVWALPWPRWRDRDDEWLNFLGYVPVGLITVVALLRRGLHPSWALSLGFALGAGLSYSMEILQSLLPQRVPSLKDWAGNATGAAVGALLAVLMHWSGWLQRGTVWRDRWFTRDSAGALILLLLWPAALLVPATVPFGLGQCWDEIESLLWSLMGHLPLSAWGFAHDWGPPMGNPARGVPSVPAQVLAIALGALSPLVLCSAAMAPGLRRLLAMLAMAAVAVVGMTLSTALNFGPNQAWSWLTPPVLAACALCLPLALLFWLLPQRWCAALALLVLAMAVAQGAQIPAGTYHELNLQSWEQGKFIRFHGLSLWVAWLWPYLAMAWLLRRLAAAAEILR